MKSRERKWAIALGLTLASWLTFCGKTSDPGSSESHFLEACRDVCAEGLSCSCGVCTIACNTDSDCSKLSSRARCTSGATLEAGHCAALTDAAASGICDVQCDTARDCSALGGGFDCVNHHCRTPPQGAGGGRASGGAAGTGGSAGSTSSGAGPSNGGAQQSDAGASTVCRVTWPGATIHYAGDPGSPCPNSAPIAGMPCDAALYGIGCVYPGDATFASVFLCDFGAAKQWQQVIVMCHDVCSTTGEAEGDVTTACSTRTVLGCPTTGHTDQENLDLQLSSLYTECSFGSENGFSVAFEHGCATHYVVQRAGGLQTQIDCLAQHLATETYDCAASLSCGRVEHSTLH